LEGTQPSSLALGAADAFDRLGGVEALLLELGVVQIFALAISGLAIEALRVDGVLIDLTRFLATFSA
jgi:hypothetical protein